MTEAKPLPQAAPRGYDEAAIRAIERPDRALFKYYVLAAFQGGPLYPLFLFFGWIRFSTLRYTFTDEGISMRWGRLFRSEIILNYARIQDIHLRSNIVERWFGLARILVQTASGNSGAEMTIEGLKEYEAVRDFLYSKMRGVADVLDSAAGNTSVHQGRMGTEVELTQTMREVAHELQRIREALEAWQAPPGPPPAGPAPDPRVESDATPGGRVV